MFTNYSQTYASAITSLVGLIFTGLSLFHITIPYTSNDIEFALGVALNFGGLIWNMLHRHSQGDITALGARK